MSGGWEKTSGQTQKRIGRVFMLVYLVIFQMCTWSDFMVQATSHWKKLLGAIVFDMSSLFRYITIKAWVQSRYLAVGLFKGTVANYLLREPLSSLLRCSAPLQHSTEGLVEQRLQSSTTQAWKLTAGHRFFGTKPKLGRRCQTQPLH